MKFHTDIGWFEVTTRKGRTEQSRHKFFLQGPGRGRRIQSEKGDPDPVEDGDEEEPFVTTPPTDRGDFDKQGEKGDEEIKADIKNGTTVAIASPEDDEEGLDDGPGITITVPSPQVPLIFLWTRSIRSGFR